MTGVCIRSFSICGYHSAVGQGGMISLILFQHSQHLLDQIERWKCMYIIAHLLPLTVNALSATTLTSSTFIVASLIHFPGCVHDPCSFSGSGSSSGFLSLDFCVGHSTLSFLCDWENISFPCVTESC